MKNDIFSKLYKFLLLSFPVASALSWKVIDIVFVLLIVTILSEGVLTRSFVAQWNSFKALKWANLFIGLWLVSSILGYFLATDMGPERVEEIFGLRWIISFYACVYAGTRVDFSENELRWLLSIFVGVLLLGVGYQYLVIKHGPRFEGTYENANIFAYTLLIPWTILLVFEAMLYRKRKSTDPLLAFSIFTVGVMIFFTMGRSSWLAMGLIFTAVSLILRVRRNMYVIAAGALGLLLAFQFNFFGFKDRIVYSFDFSSGSSQSVRVNLWRVNWEIFKDHPVFGIGFYENIRMTGDYYVKMGIENYEVSTDGIRSPVPYLNHAHNQLLQIMAGSGAVGTVSYLAMFSMAIFYFFRRTQRVGSERVKYVAMAGMLACLVHLLTGLVECPLMVHQSRSWLIFVAGICFGILAGDTPVKESSEV
ncbi:O-antigen ligase family protein [Bdellovibrio sp. HCB209]|uniref:O-antigen ligase family protein n=1 Tax=Bdellovibrio sp. HCB209 TaxID=3394354 RepID=UPI0039B56652